MRNLLELFEEIENVLWEIGVDPRDLIDGKIGAKVKAEEVRVVGAHQPSWPLPENLTRLKIMSASAEEESEDEDGWSESEPLDEDDEKICWVVLNGHPHDMSPYAPSSVFGGW